MRKRGREEEEVGAINVVIRFVHHSHVKISNSKT